MIRAAPLLVLLVTGCAYFNGVYNARQAEQQGDRHSRTGQEQAARDRYLAAAEQAEAVLTRHPDSRWAAEARYIAGRSWAMAERCTEAAPHLRQWLAHADSADRRRPHATLALGRCLISAERFADARDLLHPIALAGDAEVHTESAIWAARAALGVGDYDAARAYLVGVGESHADWELAFALAGDGRVAEAEPLLLARARAGDVRDELYVVLDRFSRAGALESVDRIVTTYDATAAHPVRARLHLLVGEMWMAHGEDGRAFAHFTECRQLARSGTLAEVAAARLTLLSLRDLPTLLDVAQHVSRELPHAGGSPEHRRLWSSVLLTDLLARHSDYNGASLFLAGEIARDSLRAHALARTLFLQAVELHPRSPVAPKALLALSALHPDVPWYRARLLADYPASPYADITRREEPRERDEMVRADALLERSWDVVSRVHADSLARSGATELTAGLGLRPGARP